MRAPFHPLALLTLCGTLLTACGGGGSDAPPPVPTTPAGWWSGTTGTCLFSGRLTPRSDVNADDLTIGFSGFPCTSPNQDFTGVAYFDTTQRTLIGASTNTAQDSAALLVASR